MFHMRNLTYHTEKPKHNIQYLCFGKKILSKLYAHNSFKESNNPVGKWKRGRENVVTNTKDLTHMFPTQAVSSKQALLSSQHTPPQHHR